MNEDTEEILRYLNKPRCFSMNKYQCNICSEKVKCKQKGDHLDMW